MMRLIQCAFFLFSGSLLYALPQMMRRGMLFAVPVPPVFRESQAAARAIHAYRTAVAIVTIAGLLALLFSPVRAFAVCALAAPLVQLLTAGVSFYSQNRKLAPAAVQFTQAREAELTAAPDQLPRFTWSAVGPFAILTAAATWLTLNWDRIPLRFPVHYGPSGPDRWADRSTKGIYGFLLFGAEICTWILVMSLASWFGSRRTAFRTSMLGFSIAIAYMVAVLFSCIGLSPLLDIPIAVTILLPLAFLVPAVLILARRSSEPSGPVEATPNECWTAGIFYYNPNDAALAVEKRDSLGYTLNFGNPWSWALLGGLLLVIASAPFVLP